MPSTPSARSDSDRDPRPAQEHAAPSRRTVLRAGGLVAVGGLTATALAACSGAAPTKTSTQSSAGGATTPAGSSSSGTPTRSSAPAVRVASAAGSVSPTPREQTVVIDDETLVPFTVFNTFNPLIPNGEQYQGGVGQFCREYLFYYDAPTGKIIPWLGTAWSYANNSTQFILSLNPKAHWNDGQPFTSADVLYTVDLLQKNPALLGGGPIITEIKKITAPDAHTIKIELTKPDPRYHYNWICGIVASFIILPQHIWSKQNPSKFANNPPVYTGPYKLKQANATLKLFVWEKDPNYWNIGALDAKPRYLVVRTAPPPDVELAQFKDAAVDQATSNDYTLVSSAMASGYKQAMFTTMQDPCPRALWMNCDASHPLGDYRMRHAISMLIDRKKLASTVYTPATVPASYPWAAYAANKKWEIPEVYAKYQDVFTYNPDQAKKLMSEAGATLSGGKWQFKGKPLTLDIITPLATPAPAYLVGQAIAQSLQSVGIGSSIRTLAGSVYSQDIAKGDFDLRSEWLCGELFDPWQVYNEFNDAYLEPIGQQALTGNNVRLKDPTFTGYVDKLAALSPTDAAAAPLFRDALDRYFYDLPCAPIAQMPTTMAFNTTFWTGWPTNSNLYQVPDNWWGQFMFVIGKLQPTGATVG